MPGIGTRGRQAWVNEVMRLKAKLAEQDREIERLRAALAKILGWREDHDRLPERTAQAVVEFVEEVASQALAGKEKI